MFAALRQRQPGHSLGRILWWYFLWSFCFVWMHLCYRYRSFGARRIPTSGPVLLVSNHQSFLDPIIVGVAGHRRQFYAMARSTLFDNRFFAWLIRSLNAIPVVQGTADMAAMRRSIEVLQAEQALLIFPEGARTLTGRTEPFATGTMLIIKRARPAVVPVAIEGAFHAWRRGRALPRLFGRVRVAFGEPIPAQRLLEMGAEGALEHLQNTVEAMRRELAGKGGKANSNDEIRMTKE